MLASPLLRAQQTAAILTQFAGWPRAPPCPQLLPDAPPAELLALLARAREPRVSRSWGISRISAGCLRSCLPGSAGSAAFELRKMGSRSSRFTARPAPAAASSSGSCRRACCARFAERALASRA